MNGNFFPVYCTPQLPCANINMQYWNVPVGSKMLGSLWLIPRGLTRTWRVLTLDYRPGLRSWGTQRIDPVQGNNNSSPGKIIIFKYLECTFKTCFILQIYSCSFTQKKAQKNSTLCNNSGGSRGLRGTQPPI